MNGSISERSTDLPRIRAATVIETVDSGASPVPFSINTRTNATTCRATKKKIVGGSTANNSSLNLEVSLLIASPQGWLPEAVVSSVADYSIGCCEEKQPPAP